MSGIVGIVHPDSPPVEGPLLRRMTEHMAFRGPHARRTWLNGAVGLGHASLRTTVESAVENQPESLDSQVWITADLRVDGRQELMGKLRARGRSCRPSPTDAELVLHAYGVWGDDCVQHLLGDFAFAIWDGPGRRLFCARDPFGIKPLYYARLGDGLVLSNTLSCLRSHPAVSPRLDDLAIADFLLFDFSRDPAATAFAQIRRLPPAHALTWSSSAGLRVHRYWELAAPAPIRYRRMQDYVDHFRTLFHQAVADRLRTERVGVWMSGGLDSTAVAATAKSILIEQHSSFDLRSYTTVYDGLIPDRERHYAGLVADTLGIPVHYLIADGYTPYQDWHQPELNSPEPDNSPLAAMDADQFRQILTHSHVVLSGYGADPALCPSGSHLLDLVKGRQLGRLLADAGQYLWRHRRLPPFGVRTRLRGWFGRSPPGPSYPPWLSQELERRLNLADRWQQGLREDRPVLSSTPPRTEAHGQLASPLWAHGFESYDPGSTRFAVEARHPFFDLRLVDYLLAIPSTPCCVDKELLRVAMRGILPGPVLRRPKTPLAGEPLAELLKQRPRWVDGFNWAPELAKYVDTDRLRRALRPPSTDDLWRDLRPVSLHYWLRQLERETTRDVPQDPRTDHELSSPTIR